MVTRVFRVRPPFMDGEVVRDGRCCAVRCPLAAVHCRREIIGGPCPTSLACRQQTCLVEREKKSIRRM